MRNSLAPGFVKLFYTSNGHDHIMVIPVKPFAGVGGVWFVEHKGGGPGQNWTVAVDALVDVIKPFFAPASDFTLAELWTVDEPAGDPIYVESHNVNESGTNAGAATPLSQVVLTYRTQEGGIYRMYLMEPSTTANVKQSAPYGAGIAKDLSDYLISSSSFVVGRDTSFLVTPVRFMTKTNDALRKKYLVNT